MKRILLVALSVLLVSFLVSRPGDSAAESSSSRADDVTKSRIQAAFLSSPLRFEANQGQTDAKVKFLSRGKGYTLFLTPTEAVLTLRKAEPLATGTGLRVPELREPTQPNKIASILRSSKPEATASAVLRLQLVGANPAPEVTGVEELSGKVNYFLGNDPTQWRTNVPTYAKVQYRAIYPGIDLIYYGNQRQLEYDFLVAPGADPKIITLAFEGADQLEINDQGALVLHTPAGPPQTLDLQVKTIRSALNRRKLTELFDAVPAELADIVMVPVLSPRAEFEDPVGEQFAWRSKFRPQPPINVQNIRDCYLQQGELTRRQYQAIVDKTLPGLVADAGDADLWRQLVFPADPKGKARLNAAAMLPAVHRGHAAAWQQQLRDGPQRPVTGVNFYQAYTATRLAGWLVAQKPDLFRLPLGVEMELAALGPSPGGARLHGGSAGTGSAAARSVTYADHRRASRQMALAGRWPPTRTENEAMGDLSGSRGTLLGLDFGVREWVMDLPWLEHPAGGMIRSLHSDYQRHLQASTMFLTNKYLAHVHKELGALGVVRGLALGEVALLRDALDPQAGNGFGDKPLPVTVPGVVRTLHVRRDGGGVLPDEPDPHLGKVGLRLCGEAAFVAEARRR